MLAGPKPAGDLLETYALAGLRLAWACFALPKLYHASMSEDLFVRRVHEPHWPDLSSVTWPEQCDLTCI